MASKPREVELPSKKPVGGDGIVTKCHLGESFYHYASNCPKNERLSEDVQLAKKKENSSSDGESLITITLITCTNLQYECINKSIPETAGTVCGQEWLDHLACLSRCQRKNVKAEESSIPFVLVV